MAGRGQLLGRCAHSVVALVVVLGALPLAGHLDQPRSAPAPLASSGVALTRDGLVVAVPPDVEAGFVSGTSLLAGGPGAWSTTPAGAAAVAESRRWLAAGWVPGQSPEHRAMAERALLDLRLLARNGVVLAAPHGAWRYVWPRDASFVAAALAATGHRREAWRVLAHLAEIAPSAAPWEARYRPDASGVSPDNRPRQGDGAGWVLWATWFWYASAELATPRVATTTGRPSAELSAELSAGLAALWPMVATSADVITGSLAPNGLPPPSSDYWERAELTATLGSVAPQVVGLRAAAALAQATGHRRDGSRWDAAAADLERAVRSTFGSADYPRSPGGGADAAVTFLAPPFRAPDRAVAAAVSATAARLAMPVGGVRPGEDWHTDDAAWTPESALFALAASAGGRPWDAVARLDWLAAHRTALGSLPEKIDRAGLPSSVAPLAWTAASVLLALVALEHPLPVPPG